MAVSLTDVAKLAGVSVKTVSGALHGGSPRMSEETRERIRKAAEELGYVTNAAAQSMRRGYMPIIGIVADEIMTTPFATEIMRGLDNTARKAEMAVVATAVSIGRDVAAVVEDVRRFRPKAIGYAAMYHKVVDLPAATAKALGVMINCRDSEGRVPALVPDEEAAAAEITAHILDSGRRRIAYINLPGLLAGELREAGFRRALMEAGQDGVGALVLPAVRRIAYNDRAPSLVAQHVEALMASAAPPDAILAGNDRVAMDIYAVLRRLGAVVPDDVAVAGFDNQVDIATRLDPPLTTMALPHRAMGRMAAELLLGDMPAFEGVRKLPFHLVDRESV